jgi:hypothetical protein
MHALILFYALIFIIVYFEIFKKNITLIRKKKQNNNITIETVVSLIIIKILQQFIYDGNILKIKREKTA